MFNQILWTGSITEKYEKTSEENMHVDVRA